MKIVRTNSTLVHSALAISLTLMAALGFGLIAIAAGIRLVVVIFGAAGLLYLLATSPNPRRLLLWILLISLPMALSKHFDTIVFKGGGEQSFRIELYDLFVMLLLVAQLRDNLAGRIRGLRIPRVTWFWVAIMVIGVIDVITGPYRTSGAHELVRMFKVMLLFIVLVNEIHSPKQILDCAIPIAIGVLVQSGVAILQYLKGGLLGLEVLGETTAKTIENLAYTSIEGSLAFRPSGLLLHANILGIYLAITLPILIASILKETRFLVRAFLLVVAALGLAGLILTQSRSAWVGFAIAYFVLLVLLLSHRKLRGRSFGVAVASAVTMLLVFIPFSDRILTRLFASKSDATVGRAVFAEDFYRLINDHWLFGVGLNSYSYEIVPYLSFSVSIYNNWIPPVHNIYYLWWAETGIFGLALHLALWLSIIWIAIRNLRVQDEILFAINASCIGSMAALIFDGFLSFSLRVNQPQRIFFLLAAFVLAIHYWQMRNGRIDRA